MTKVALFGLGSMGFGIGQSLLRAGLSVHGFDLDEVVVGRFRRDGGGKGDLKTVANTFEIAAIAVVSAAQTEAVLFGDTELAALLPKGAVVIGCATVPPRFARNMEAQLAERGLLYLDAPISGAKGTLARFEGVDIGRRIFIHINNSNPILDENSPARRDVEKAGWAVAFDGMELEL